MSGKFEDLTGRRFSHLVAIERLGVPEGAKWKTSKWRVKCDCGAVKDVNAGDLKSGKTTSCGHVQREKARARCLSTGGVRNGNKREAP